MATVISSTTDTQEDVNLAAGIVPEEVERPKEAEASEAEQAKTTPEPETGEKPSAPKPHKKLLKRIDTLTARNRALEDELEQLRKTPKTEESKPAADTEPKRESFASDAEYYKAQAKWEVRQELRAERQREQQEAENARLRQIFDDYNTQISKAREQHEDFDEIVGRSDVHIPTAVQLAIFEMENGADVAYHLGKHPDLCEELMGMSELSAVRAVGRISDSLAPAKESPKKTESKAPPPIKPVASGSTRTTVPLDETDYRAYRRRRDAGEG